jgi:hypothetical protein
MHFHILHPRSLHTDKKTGIKKKIGHKDEAMKPKTIGVLAVVSLISIPLLRADDERYEHWSDGIYFQPQNQTGESPREEGYPAMGKRRYNPWATGAERKSPTSESLGYPSLDYDPYENTSDDRHRPPGRYNAPLPQSNPPSGEGGYYSREYLPPPAITDYAPLYDPHSFNPGYAFNPYSVIYGAGLHPLFYGLSIYPWLSPSLYPGMDPYSPRNW